MCHIFYKNYKLPKDLKLDLGGFDSVMKEIEINLDKIAQDIRERKDNAMAMEFTRVIGELLKKNGVSVKITEYQTENHATNKFEMLYGCSIDGLDFSEHDKVFEDKIADLEKRIRELIKEKDEYKRRCNDFEFENQDLKKIIKDYEDKIATLEEKLLTSANTAEQNRRRSFALEMKNQDLKNITKGYEDKIAELENIINHKLGNLDKHGITYQEILDMKAENDLLKQRIVELESKEMGNFREIDTSNPLACAESLIEHMTHCEKFMIMPERDVQTFSVEELKEIADYLMVYYKHHKDRDAEDTISF